MPRLQKTCSNVVWHTTLVTRSHRERMNGHRSVVLWFTGLSNSGKSTIAHRVEERLHRLGCRTFVFDGDNVRHGLCSDLGFSPEHRKENIRRIGEMARLFIEAGVISIAAFISPYDQDRKWLRTRAGSDSFIEIYCECPLEICEQRDVKGHYKKARRGEIPEFTGVSAPYEPPENPEIHLTTHEMTEEECAEAVVAYLIRNAVLFDTGKNEPEEKKAICS
ncbi:MAG: adenylyl-sulfate kinase [Nitrospirota bacterium]